MTRRMIPALLFGLVGTAILIWLGVWQVQRLAWKTEILERIEARITADPVALPDAPDPAADQYLRVLVAGSIEPGELHVYTSAPPRGVGYRVIAPLRLGDGRRILLDRGFVPIADKDEARHLGPIRVQGSLLWPDETDGFTDAPDREKNIWFARDVERMSAALGTLPVMLVTEASDDAAAPLAAAGDDQHPQRPPAICDHLVLACRGLGGDDSLLAMAYQAPDRLNESPLAMQYISTRGAAPKLGFEEAMLAGLARDGGLYLPETWPQLSHGRDRGFRRALPTRRWPSA